MHLILLLVALACQRSAATPTKNEEKYDGGGQQLKNQPKDVHRAKRSSENYAALGAVYPVQVDLTDWIVRSEKRMENLTALVESHFRGIATLIEGFQKKFEDLDERIHSLEGSTQMKFKHLEERTQKNFEDLDERIHSLEKKTQKNFDETNNRIQSMENSLEKLKENCSRPWVDYATGKPTDSTMVNDQSRVPFTPTSPSTFPTSITPTLSSTEWSCNVDPCAVSSPWILIMERDTADEYSFGRATWKQYRGGFGNVHSRYYVARGC